MLLCTHNLPLAERVCDHFGFLKEGTLVASGSTEELLTSLARKPELRIITEDSEGAEVTEIVEYADEAEIPRLVRARLDRGAALREVRRARPTLEEVYFSYIGEGKT